MIILIILPIDRNWLTYYGRWGYDDRLSQTIKGADNQVSGTKRGIGKQDVQRAGTKQMLSAADIFWKKRCLPWEHFSGYVNILRRYR